MQVKSKLRSSISKAIQDLAFASVCDECVQCSCRSNLQAKAIFDRLRDLTLGHVVSCYASMKCEVQTREIVSFLLIVPKISIWLNI
jgi:hypothetical protein